MTIFQRISKFFGFGSSSSIHHIGKEKMILIESILDDLFDQEFYQGVYDILEKDAGIEDVSLNKYQDEIERFKTNLRADMAVYFDKKYSADDLTTMLNDERSNLWIILQSADYLEIIKRNTQQFVYKVIAKKNI